MLRIFEHRYFSGTAQAEILNTAFLCRWSGRKAGWSEADPPDPPA